MKAHRWPWIIAAVGLAGGLAFADLVPPHPSDVGSVPPECEQFLRVPSPTTSATVAWERRLSTTACTRRPTPIPVDSLARLPGLVAELQRAEAPTVRAYLDAMTYARATSIRLRAGFALGMTHRNTIVLAHAAIRVLPDAGAFGGDSYAGAVDTGIESTSSPERALVLHDALDGLLAGERAAAVAAFDDVAHIAGEDPIGAAADPVTVGAVDRARRERTLLQPVL